MSIEKSTLEGISRETFTHIITTDNPVFKNAGLGSFTTGVLFEYFTARDNEGAYINKDVIRDSGNEEITTIADIFGAPPLPADNLWGSWQGWRPERDVATGRFILQNWDDFTKEIPNKGNRREYDFDLSKFAPNESGIPNIATVVTQEDEDEEETKTSASVDYSIIASNPTIINGLPFSQPANIAVYGARYLQDADFIRKVDCPVCNLITLNDYMLDLTREYGSGNWDSWDNQRDSGDEGIYSFGADQLYTMQAMLRDIKTSKTKTVQFSGLLTFNTELFDGKFECDITQWVKFDLKLFDKPMEVMTKPTPVPKSNYVADFRTDAFGRQMLNKQDGDITPLDGLNTTDGQKTMAAWNMSYNEYLNRWETGTKQMMAKLLQDVPAAQNPGADKLQTMNIQEALDDDANSGKFIPGTGYALPIFMQNGNPFQWAPNYSKAKDCRDEDLVKHQVRAFNFAATRRYKADEMVTLNQIEGVWHISPLDKTDDVVSLSQAKNWAFQYFLMTRDEFFKGRDIESNLDNVTPFDAERICHKSYYEGDIKQVDITYNDQFSSAGYSESNGFRKVASSWQVSSFDFMDNQIFGSRPYNAIGTTNATIDAAGRTIPQQELYRNAGHSGPFFGCVFPDGYIGAKIGEVLNESRNWKFKVCESGKAESGSKQDAYVTPFSVNDDNAEGNPFFDVYSGPDSTSTIRQPLAGKDQTPVASRHDLVSATKKDFYIQEDLSATERENKWYWPWFRDGAAYYGPDMFYQYNREGLTDFRQLPADIAMLDSPNVSNGAPWYNVHRYKFLYKSTNEGINWTRTRGNLGVKKNIPSIFGSAAWICKEGLTEDVTYTPEDTPFGWEPANRNKIQFRPLKMETYLAYNEWHSEVLSGGDSDSVDYGNGPVTHDPFGEGYWPFRLTESSRDAFTNWLATFAPDADINGSVLDFNKSVAPFAYKSWRNHMSRFFRTRGPMVDIFGIKAREEINNYNELPFMYRNDNFPPNDDGITPPAGGLKIGTIDIQSALDQSNRMFITLIDESYFIREAESEIVGPRFQDIYMNRGQGVNNITSPGIVGVIGASCTVGARTNIQFDTENYFGMESVSLPTAIDAPKESPSWGGFDGYNARNTYALSVTVYQSHPVEQTIYDPEYFCVHHFNKSPELEASWTFNVGEDGGGQESYNKLFDEPYAADHGDEWPYFEEEDYNFPNPDNSEERLEGTAKFYKPFTGLELTIPTRLNAGQNIIQNIPEGTATFEDFDVGGNPIFPEDQWSLNLTRVGKLLPYRYKNYVNTVDLRFILLNPLGISRVVDLQNPPEDGFVFNTFDIPEGYTVTAQASGLNNLCIAGLGQDYEVGDIVGNADYGLTFEVTETSSFDDVVGIVSSIKYTGPVTEEIAEALGEDYVGVMPSISPKVFLERDKEIDNRSFFGLKFETISSAQGRNFEVFMVNGKVEKTYGIDQKPKYIARERRISADSDKTTDQDVKFGIVQEQRQDSIQIPSGDVSSNFEYDLFFHAQNDPAFCWNSSGDGEYFSSEFQQNWNYFGDQFNTSELGEQYINCTILTT